MLKRSVLSLLLLSIGLGGCMRQKGVAPVERKQGSLTSHLFNKRVIVTEGDTVAKIAQRYGITVKAIVEANKLRSPDRIYVGQSLLIPSPKQKRGQKNVPQRQKFSEIGDTFHPIKAQAPVRVTNIAPPPVTEVQPLPAQAVQEEEKSLERNGKKMILPPLFHPRDHKESEKQKEPLKFSCPVHGKVLSWYGPKDGGVHNDGINIGAPKGTEIKATADGVVIYEGDQIKGYGQLILLKHQGDWMSAYGHVDKFLVQKGDIVKRGQPIALVGRSGHAPVPQVHFELRQAGKTVNPWSYMNCSK